MGLREAYQEMHQARLRELDAEIQQLEAKAMQARASDKILYYEELQAIYKKRDAAEAKLEALKQASGEAWQEFKHEAGFSHAWSEFRRHSEDFRSRSSRATEYSLEQEAGQLCPSEEKLSMTPERWNSTPCLPCGRGSTRSERLGLLAEFGSAASHVRRRSCCMIRPTARNEKFSCSPSGTGTLAIPTRMSPTVSRMSFNWMTGPHAPTPHRAGNRRAFIKHRPSCGSIALIGRKETGREFAASNS